MSTRRHMPPTSEKLEAISKSLLAEDFGQVAMAADLAARLTEHQDSARQLCTDSRGELILRACLQLAARQGVAGDVRADIMAVLRNALAVPEGQAIICKSDLIRPILESPPQGQGRARPSQPKPAKPQPAEPGGEVSAEGFQGDGGTGGPAEGSTSLAADHALELQAWLGLALSAVTCTHGSILDGPKELTSLQDAVFLLCEETHDLQAMVDGLNLLRHLFEKKPQGLIEHGEAARLAGVVRNGLTEALGDSNHRRSRSRGGGHNNHDQSRDNDVLAHVLHLLSIVGAVPMFRAALFQVDDEDLDSEQLPANVVQKMNTTISYLFAAMQRIGHAEPSAWKAMSSIAEVKFVRRLMRMHTEVRGMFACVLNSLENAGMAAYSFTRGHLKCGDANANDARLLTEQVVSFLKQIFTGATDQFLSTEPIMFENLGRSEGLKKLLVALLKSWRDHASTTHRGNIVAFLADAMFFSSFTDDWQKHEQANELISILFDALTHIKGVEGTAGLALGNFVSANGHIDLILDHPNAKHSIENVGWYLKRTAPGWDTKMQIYYLWRVLRSRKGCKLLSKHPHSDLVVQGLLTSIKHATMEDNEVLSLLECFLNDDDTRPVVLQVPNTAMLLDGVCELLSNGDPDLQEPSCLLLQALLEATGPGALLAWPGASRLIGVLSRCQRHAKDILDSAVPLMQWEPALTSSLSLEYKRVWISDQIRGGQHGDAAVLCVSRSQILKGLSEGLRDGRLLQHGVEVKFQGDGETGMGDGHRREFFRLAAAALTDLEFGLFRSNDGGRTLHPSSTAPDVQPDFQIYFELLGKLMALALLHRETLPAARFTLALRKLLMGAGPLTIEDMASVDPEYFKHKVVWLLEAKYAEGDNPMSLSDLEMYFEDAPQPDVFPDVRVELFPGGSKAEVTEDNKKEYVELLCDTRMRGSVMRQVDAIKRGLCAIVPFEVWCQIQRVVTPAELDLLVCGLQEVDIADWKANSLRADGVENESWDMFWQVAEEFSPHQRKQLLEFATGSPGPPVGGFAALPGYGAIGNVQRFTLARQSHSALPVAQTCFNTLYLPNAASKVELAAALKEAIANRDGFYEGAAAQAANSSPGGGPIHAAAVAAALNSPIANSPQLPRVSIGSNEMRRGSGRGSI